MTFYRGAVSEGNKLDEQTVNATDGTATYTISADAARELEPNSSYTFTAVHTPDPAGDDDPLQLEGTGSTVLAVWKEIPETSYLIGTAEKLADFRDMVNNGETNAKTTATLTADIDLGDETWTPIMGYTGTFDGGGHTISGLYVDSDTGRAGLFGSVAGGTVRNLAVEGKVTASGETSENYSYTGGVVGENSGTVENCAFSGIVADNSVIRNNAICVGGVAGYNTGTVQNCYSTGSVTATDDGDSPVILSFTGGVVGRNGGLPDGTVKNCYYRNGEGYPTVGIGTTGEEKDVVGQAEGKPKAAFESGEVAYLLNNNPTSEEEEEEEEAPVWRQNLDNGAVPDGYPVPDDSHGVVYKIEDDKYSNSTDGTRTISGCTVTLSEDKDTFTYNRQRQTPTVKSVLWGKEETALTEDDYTVKYPDPGDSVNADTYEITITGTGDTYAGSVTVTYTIKKATLTAACKDVTVTEGEAPALEVSVTGFVNDEDAESAEDYKAPVIDFTQIDANSYTLTPVGGEARNYTFHYVSGTLTFLTGDTGGDTPGGGTGTGGGSGSPTYRPDVEQPEGGEVSVSPRNPHRGDTVTVTPEPDEGYEVDEDTVTDKNGSEVEVTDNGDGTFSFTQPSGKVTIEVTFRETEPEPLPFTDVPAGVWYEDAVRYVYENGLMAGTGADAFDPEGATTRAMVVTILWRLSGSPVVDYLMDFSDVDPAAWYGEAVRWAASEGVAGGYGDGRFGPDDPITREQLAVMLYQCARRAGLDLTAGGMALRDFADCETISPWALEAMGWAVGQGIIGGTSPTTLTPQGQATRAQAAVMLMRFCQLDK